MESTEENLNLETVNPELVPETAELLVRWLRTFWTKLYKDKDFVKYLQGSRAIRFAQLYLDILENARLLDHSKAPVFHRERWYPIVVRKNRQNEADAAVARVGEGGIKLSDGVIDGYSEQIKMGEYVVRSDVVAYALSDDVKKVVSCIVDNIAEPTVVLQPGKDFTLSRKSILVRKDVDPFGENSGFPVFEVPETPDSPATEEAVLWACDTLIDKDYLFKHVGYAVGLETESTDAFAGLVKSVWDATTDGLSIVHIKQILGALCRVPCIKDETETVESIYATGDAKTIVTDKNTYVLDPEAELLENVKTGNTLMRGEFLDTSVRMYPFVVDVDRVKGYSGFELQRFQKDVTSMSIPSALISGDDTDGFYVGWGERPVVFCGNDSNGNPKLRFDLEMDSDKEDRYWTSVWDKYEKRGDSMAACFDGLSFEGVEYGGTCGEVVPIKFFMRNLVGANTLIIVVDTDRIPEDAPLYDPNFFHVLRKLVPEYVRLYFVEHGSVIDGEDDSEDEPENDGAEVSASLNADDDEYSQYEDDVVNVKWVKKCRSSEKEEDYDD